MRKLFGFYILTPKQMIKLLSNTWDDGAEAGMSSFDGHNIHKDRQSFIQNRLNKTREEILSEARKGNN